MLVTTTYSYLKNITMKIYKQPPPVEVIRLCITRAGEKKEFLTVDDCTPEECEIELKKIISTSNKVTIFTKGQKTNIQIRRAIGAKNLESFSFTFYGLSAIETKELILSALNKEN